jgi:AcrR family transcriptional regulator
MAERVKPKRPYDSPRRREQAAATRLEILEAAQRLFERDGYAATTMAAIAAEARVALKTVYVAFETKSGVLRALWNVRLRAGAEDVPIAAHAIYREVLEEPDAERQVRLNARNSRAGKLRVAAIAEVIRSAAPLDGEIASLWDRISTEYHDNQRAIVQSITDKRALHPSLDVQRATDILWAINHPNTWQLLVRERGWTPDEYERWAAETACAQLLDPRRGRGLPSEKRGG